MPVIDQAPIPPLVRGKFLTELDQFPPFLLRYFPIIRGSAISQRELASRTGWSRAKIKYMMKQQSWAEFTLVDAQVYARACGVEFGEMDKMLSRFKEIALVRGFKHIQDRQAAALRRRFEQLPADHPAAPKR